MTRIGILALQGAFSEHERALTRLNSDYLDIDWVEIRHASDMCQSIEGLILPGGESTVMAKLLGESALFTQLQSLIREGLPVLGTCAGLILLANKVIGSKDNGFATMNITARRNAYGRQLGSFCTEAEFAGKPNIPMTFIRAPYIDCVGDNVEILSTVGGHIVAARQENQLVTAFHPELTNNKTVHQYFLEHITKNK